MKSAYHASYQGRGGGWLVHIMDMQALLLAHFSKDGVPREGGLRDKTNDFGGDGG